MFWRWFRRRKKDAAPTHYGAYEIQRRCKARDGREYILGFDPDAAQRYCTGIMPGCDGFYTDDHDTARFDFVQRIAQDYGLVVGPPKSVIVRRGDLERLTASAQALNGAGVDWKLSGIDGMDPEEAGDALRNASEEFGVLVGEVTGGFTTPIAWGL